MNFLVHVCKLFSTMSFHQCLLLLQAYIAAALSILCTLLKVLFMDSFIDVLVNLASVRLVIRYYGVIGPLEAL